MTPGHRPRTEAHRAVALPHQPVRPRTTTEHERARRALRRGELQQLLPNVYGPPGSLDSLPHRAAALQLLDPDAVITGGAAAALTWWPGLSAPFVTAARSNVLTPAPGYRWERRRIPPELVTEHEGLLLTGAALTVLDPIPRLEGNAIDEALRRRAVTLPQLWRALELTPNRRGNRLRWTLLHDSRDEPWSEAERSLHRRYRAAALPWAYATNHWVTLSDGRRAALDLAIPELRQYFEVDGFETHGTRRAFEHDRDRDSDLEAQGWHGTRFSASFLEHQGEEATRRMAAICSLRARLHHSS